MRELKHEEIANFPEDANVGDIIVTLLAKIKHHPTVTAEFFDPKIISIRVLGNLSRSEGNTHWDFLIWRKGTDVHCGFYAPAKEKETNDKEFEWQWFTKSILDPVSRESNWITVSAFRKTVSEEPLGSMWNENTAILDMGDVTKKKTPSPTDPGEIRHVSKQFAENLFKDDAWEPENHRELLVNVLRNRNTPGQSAPSRHPWHHSSVKPKLCIEHENDFPKSQLLE